MFFTVLIDGISYQADMVIVRKPYETPWHNMGITFTTLRRQVASRTFTLADMDTIDPVSQMLTKIAQDKTAPGN